jgi:hypothetical protein
MADAQSAPYEEARMNVDAAAHFLRGQASWLCRALMGPGDPSAVGTVLGAHDRSHESWLTLIAGVARVDDDAAQRLASLYGLHGRIVGSLERGIDLRLADDVAEQVRRLLSLRLQEATDEAITALAFAVASSGGSPSPSAA